MRNLKMWVMTLAFAMALPFAAQAQNDAAKAEMEAAIKDVKAARVDGPAEVKLLDQGRIKLPAGYTFVPVPAAAKLMRAMGNGTIEGLIGMIFPDQYRSSFVVVRYEKSGYIKDDDARDWKADELFDSLKSGTEVGNEERRSRGLPEMEVLGWVQRPSYDAATHRLIWSISTRDKGTAPDISQGVNYNTYALGREGYVSMNLVTDLKNVEAQKPMAALLLGALDFDSGKRYADFNSSTDKVAEYGLAALVGGIALKKLGLFAIIAAFIAKFFKVFLIGLFALIPGLRKVFKRKKPEPPADPVAEKVFVAPGVSGFPDAPPPADPFPPTRPLPVDPFPPTQPLPAEPFPHTRPLGADGFPAGAPQAPADPQATPAPAAPLPPAKPPGTPQS